MKRVVFSSACLALGLLALPLLSAATAAKQLWSTPLGGDGKWHQLTGLGTLLVGTDAALVSVSPTTKAASSPRWTSPDITIRSWTATRCSSATSASTASISRRVR